jgi:hypothetical protein
MSKIALIIISVLLVCAIVAIGILAAEYTKCQHKLDRGETPSEKLQQTDMKKGDVDTTKDGKYIVACACGTKTNYKYDDKTGKDYVELATGASFTHGNKKYTCYC